MMHCSQILTPLQIARATIEAYPYMKDVFGIMEAVAAEVRIVVNSAAAGAPLEVSTLHYCCSVLLLVVLFTCCRGLPSKRLPECMDSRAEQSCCSDLLSRHMTCQVKECFQETLCLPVQSRRGSRARAPSLPASWGSATMAASCRQTPPSAWSLRCPHPCALPLHHTIPPISTVSDSSLTEQSSTIWFPIVWCPHLAGCICPLDHHVDIR